MDVKNTLSTEAKIKELGTAIHAVTIPAAGYGKGPSGEDWIYAVTGGSPAVFNVIDAHSGKQVLSFQLEGADNAWGVTVDPNGIVYAGTYPNAILFRYVPGSNHIQNLGTIIPGEIFIWRISSDTHGRIYGGTFPNGKVFQYNPSTNTCRDYGQIVPGQQYARSIDIYENKAYVGIGTNGPNLVELNIETGHKKTIDLLEKYLDQTNVYDINVIGDKLFVRITGISNVLVYQLPTMELVDEIEGASGLDVSPIGPNNLAFLIIDNELYSYDIKKLEIQPTGFKQLESARGFGWIEIENKEFPEKTLIFIDRHGKIHKYNPTTGNSEIIQAQVKREPVVIQSLTQGPNGNVFIGGYFSGGLAEYDSKTDMITEYQGIGQIEGMTTHKNKLYMGVYTRAQVYSYDPSKDYEFGTNPMKHFELEDKDQDRPFAMVSAGDEVAIGTVPNYGKLGGALTLYNPETEQYSFYRHVVQNQSIISLAYRNGHIYGGTSIWGGLGVVPTEQEAKLFIWDIKKQTKVFEITPLTGEKAISALAFDNQGFLWGLSYTSLFKFDVDKQEIIQTKQLSEFDWNSIGHLWRGGFLLFDESDGYLYVQTKGGLFKLNPLTLQKEVVVKDTLLLSQDGATNLYFTNKHKLYQYQK